MAIRTRLKRIEQRVPAPDPNAMPTLQEMLAEWQRMRDFLAERQMSAEEAARRRLKVPGNRIVVPWMAIEVERRLRAWEAEEERERTKHEAERKHTQRGSQPCTSNSGNLPT